jgi:hypothetical protein
MEEQVTLEATGCVLITDLDLTIFPGISAAKTKKRQKHKNQYRAPLCTGV